MSSKTDLQGIPMPNTMIIPMPQSESMMNTTDINTNKAANMNNPEVRTFQDVKKGPQTEISTDQLSNLEQAISNTISSLEVSTPTPAVPKTSVLGIENAKRRLRAFAIQKKCLPFIPSTAGLKGSQSCSMVGKTKESNPLEAANKQKRPPKNRTTRKLLPIPDKIFPGLTELQLSYAKPELRNLKPELSYVKSDLNYINPSVSYARPEMNYTEPELPEVIQSLVNSTDEVDKKRLLVELGVPLGLIDTITTEKKMPTKAMPPIQGLIDHTKVEEFLREAVEAQKAGKIIKFQYEKQKFHNKLPNTTPVDKNRSTRGRAEDYSRSDRHRSRRREISDRGTFSRDKNSKELDRRSVKRDVKSKNDKSIVNKRESESDSKDAADVNLEDYLVCDSWSLDTEVKEDHGKSPSIRESSKNQIKQKTEEPGKDTVTEKIEKIKAFTEMFSYGIMDTDESDQDEAGYSGVSLASSKPIRSDSQLASKSTPEKNHTFSESTPSSEKIETQSQDRSFRCQNLEPNDMSVQETCESQTPEYQYPESEFSHISGDKGKDLLGGDSTDAKEEIIVKFDGKDYWNLVMKICQPIMFKHNGDDCKRETKTQPSIVYKESPKHCLCVNDREAVYKEISSLQAILVQSISTNNSFFNEEDRSSREWYPDVVKSLTCSTIYYATNWETDSSQNSESRHESRQNLKCPSPNTPQYEPDGSRTFLAQEYEKFMESVWPEIAEDEKQNACFDNSSQDLSVYNEKSKDEIFEESLLDEGRGSNKESDKEITTSPKCKKKIKIKDKKEQTKTTRLKRQKLSSSASVCSSSDSSSSDSSSSDSKEDNYKKKKNTKKSHKTKKLELKAFKKKKAEKSKLRRKLLREKQLKKKKEKAKKQKEKEDEEKMEIETVKSKAKSIKKRGRERKKKEKNSKRDISSSSSGSESDKEVKKSKKKKKAIKRMRIPSSSSPEKYKKKNKKVKKVKQKKKVENDSNSVSESGSDHFDVNVLNNIKAEKISDEEMKDISEAIQIPRPAESLEFSPRRRSNQNNNLPAEIISVSELHSEFENLRYNDIKVKQEVGNEICVDETTVPQTLDANNKSDVEQARAEEGIMETAGAELQFKAGTDPDIDTKAGIQNDIPVLDVPAEQNILISEVHLEGMEVEPKYSDAVENVAQIGYEYYGGDYDDDGFYQYENNTPVIYDEGTQPQHASVSQSPPANVDALYGDVHKQMELHQIETVVSNLTSRGEIKCDWRPGQDIVKSEIIETKRSRWGVQPKTCESDVAHTADSHPSKPPPTAAGVYRIPSILDSNTDYSDSQKVYKIETISWRPSAQYPEPSSQDYAEAYRDVYGAADQLQYGDCFAPSQQTDQHEPEHGNTPTLSLDARINIVLAAVHAKALKQEAELNPESPIPVPDGGILLNGGPDGVGSAKRPIVTKRVSFADGYNPGQDSDTEEPPVVQKRAVRRRGCAYPCPPEHPDHDPLWDALLPPPPPPGSPPPPARVAPPPNVLRARRHATTHREEVSQLISPVLPVDKYAGVTRLPKGLGHPE